mmetsp:Transcript_5085/g.6416  ORF Transcript_5085/g.6416 Transcript_5085/m.6416 type:complete len:452 (+) Transcript_5085:3-1358(+)
MMLETSIASDSFASETNTGSFEDRLNDDIAQDSFASEEEDIKPGKNKYVIVLPEKKSHSNEGVLVETPDISSLGGNTETTFDKSLQITASQTNENNNDEPKTDGNWPELETQPDIENSSVLEVSESQSSSSLMPQRWNVADKLTELVMPEQLSQSRPRCSTSNDIEKRDQVKVDLKSIEKDKHSLNENENEPNAATESKEFDKEPTYVEKKLEDISGGKKECVECVKTKPDEITESKGNAQDTQNQAFAKESENNINFAAEVAFDWTAHTESYVNELFEYIEKYGGMHRLSDTMDSISITEPISLTTYIEIEKKENRPEYLQILNKSIFDAVNEALLYCFPSEFSNCESQNAPWIRQSLSDFIKQNRSSENLAYIRETVLKRITRCDIDSANSYWTMNAQEHINKIVCTEMRAKESNWTNYQKEEVEIMFEISDLILSDLILDTVKELQKR